MMEIPKFHETFTPILDVLKDERKLRHRELINEVVKKHFADLSEEQLNIKTKTGDLLVHNRIAWGKSSLKKAGFIKYPSRGEVQITEKGKLASKKKVTLPDLENNTDFLQFYTEERSKSIDTSIIKSSSPEDLIESGINAIEAQIKADILEHLKAVDPYYFQKIVLVLLEKMGYGAYTETTKSRDGGIDGIINEDTLGLEKIYIQAKRYDSNKVREGDVRNFIGAMSGDTRKGIFVTTSTFDDAAVRKAREAHHSIILIDGPRLAELMYQFDVGVEISKTHKIKRIDGDFFEETE